MQAKGVKNVENRYLESLVHKTENAQFMMKDVKEMFRPRNAQDKTDVKKEFIK